jgi:hypothetical protein
VYVAFFFSNYDWDRGSPLEYIGKREKHHMVIRLQHRGHGTEKGRDQGERINQDYISVLRQVI